MKSKKFKAKQFGCARAFVVIWLGVVGLCLIGMHMSRFLGMIFILAMLYVIFMDPINERFFHRGAESSTRASDSDSTPVSNPQSKGKVESIERLSKHQHTKIYSEEELPDFDPYSFAEPMDCPYCGKQIPSDIKYCYYCGKSIELFQQVEEIRTDSLERMDEAMVGIDETHRKQMQSIRDYTDKIIRKYEEDPGETRNFEKFAEYYLPETVSAMEQYHTLCTLEHLDYGQTKVKEQLADSLGVIEEAFSNIYNKISTEGIYDTSADIRVLQTVLKQEGLTDSDFTV